MFKVHTFFLSEKWCSVFAMELSVPMPIDTGFKKTKIFGNALQWILKNETEGKHQADRAPS